MAAGTSATDAAGIAVSNSRRANANSDHTAGAPEGTSGALPAADGWSKPPSKFDTTPAIASTGSAGKATALSCDESVLGTIGSAAETPVRETSLIVDVIGDVATLGICAVGAAGPAESTFRTSVDSLAVAGEVFVEFRLRCVATLVSECDLRLGCCGAVSGELGDVGSFEAIVSESPGLTAVLVASDVVWAPVDVEDSDGEFVEAAVDELDGESDEESDVSARASPCPESTATPTPSVKTRPANRPISRTAFLMRDIWQDNNVSGKGKQAGGDRR